MSRFFDAIEERFTGRRKPRRVPMKAGVDIDEGVTPKMFGTLYEYSLSATFRFCGHCEKVRMGEIRRLFIEALSHEVYGDARELLTTLEVAVYGEDFDKARDTIRGLRKELYPN